MRRRMSHVRGSLFIDRAPKEKRDAMFPFSVFRPCEYPCLQAVSLGARDEMLMSSVLLVRVGPVLKIEAEAMLRENGIDPVEPFRNVVLEPGDGIADVDYPVRLDAAVACS